MSYSRLVWSRSGNTVGWADNEDSGSVDGCSAKNLHKRALSTMMPYFSGHAFGQRLAECLEDMVPWLLGLCCAGGFLWLQITSLIHRQAVAISTDRVRHFC